MICGGGGGGGGEGGVHMNSFAMIMFLCECGISLHVSNSL